MWELMRSNPAILIAAMGVMIPIIAIIFGTMTSYMRAVRRAELDAQLKHEMLQRGMSTEEIKTVIEATPQRQGKDRQRDLAAKQHS